MFTAHDSRRRMLGQLDRRTVEVQLVQNLQATARVSAPSGMNPMENS
jgi:hypothetical protein